MYNPGLYCYYYTSVLHRELSRKMALPDFMEWLRFSAKMLYYHYHVG